MIKRGIQPANSYVLGMGRESEALEASTPQEVLQYLLGILNPEIGKIVAGQDKLTDDQSKFVALSALESLLFSEILSITFAPNESKIISHGLKRTPTQRIILRQTGNAVITDVDVNWTENTIGLRNNAAVAVTLTIGLR